MTQPIRQRASQTISGKAFEYALLQSLRERLEKLTSIEVKDSPALSKAKECFERITPKEREDNLLAGSFAVNLLLDIEPRLSHAYSQEDLLQLEIVADAQGEDGDVRDVLAIRLAQQWEIGISAKHHHRAVKHPRLSPQIDFGAKWLDIPCSEEYKNKVSKIFAPLESLRLESKAKAKWDELGDYHQTLYKPLLDAFVEEILHIDSTHPNTVAERLVQYLIGKKDFYKVIKLKNKVEVQAYNLMGTLNQALGSHKPKAKVAKLKLPKRILNISYAEGSSSTIQIAMDEGWQMSFRIHTASSRIENSLKFDINLISSPHTLFINQTFMY